MNAENDLCPSGCVVAFESMLHPSAVSRTRIAPTAVVQCRTDASATLPLGPCQVRGAYRDSRGRLGTRHGRPRCARAIRWGAVLLIVGRIIGGVREHGLLILDDDCRGTDRLAGTPLFSTPPDTGQIIEPVSANPSDLAAHGYIEQEYFASGTAYSFTSRATPSDGKWTIATADRPLTARASSCDARATRPSSTGTSSWNG